jgi:FAD/FMN-containing dehydrogenase
VLGTTFITHEGQVVKSGGRTLKNVTGYDYTRLPWRSFGRLGLCAGFILKLIPRPPQSLVLEIAPESPATAAALAHNIIVNKVAPSALRLLYSPSATSLLVWLEGFPEVVAAQKALLESMAAPAQITLHSAAQTFWRGHTDNWPALDPAVTALMGKRRALLAAAETFIAKKAALSANIDLGGGRAYLKFEEGVSGDGLAKTFGLAFDKFSPGGALYDRLKKGLDPKGRFFPDGFKI